jgi:hypothetical protein
MLDNEERNTIARAGFLRSKEDHSYDARSQYLVEIINNLKMK